MSEFQRCCKTGDVPLGTSRAFDLGGKSVAVFNLDGEYFVVDNDCPHRGGPLAEGALNGDIVTCPWHGWKFNVRQGGFAVNPNQKIGSYQTRIEAEELWVAI
jgi:nitrite reductase (NADH) small subunit/3-phenylpropionate/trans-cinnamate dioxygenase ferredoxin subunit